MPFKNARDIPDGVQLKTESQFARAIHTAFAETRPTRIIETGAYKGTGSTAIICSAILATEYPAGARPKFFSVEINPRLVQIAQANTQKFRDAGVDLEFLNGLSLPRSLLPTPEQIQAMVSADDADVYIDHSPAERVSLYAGEVAFDVPDDMLDKAMRAFDYKPDFVLLDSAGHLGFVEFKYAISKLSGPCWLALDDTNHLKHYKSLRAIKQDARFKIAVEGTEKFGFCLARFNP